jgi:hypothetical protein
MVVLAVILPVLMLGVILAMGWYEDLVLPPPEPGPEQPGTAGVPLPQTPAPALPAAPSAPALPAPSPEDASGRRAASSPSHGPAGTPGPLP